MVRKIKSFMFRFETFKNWCKNTEGVTAIEFAMIAPIFFGIILMIIETGIVFAAQQLLESSVTAASRTVLTGSAQQQALSDGNNGGKSFRDRVCAGMSGLISASDCQSNIQIDMKSFSADTTSASSISLAAPVNADGKPDKTQMKCSGFGGANDYQLVRVYYQYPVYLSMFSMSYGASDSGHSLITGSAAMKLEPFTGTGTASSNTCT